MRWGGSWQSWKRMTGCRKTCELPGLCLRSFFSSSLYVKRLNVESACIAKSSGTADPALLLLKPSHYTSLLLGRDFVFVYRRCTQAGIVSSLLAAFLSLNCVQCQYKLELFTSTQRYGWPGWAERWDVSDLLWTSFPWTLQTLFAGLNDEFLYR